MNIDLSECMEADLVERVLFTQEILDVEQDNPHVETFSVSDARRLLLAKLIAEWASLPLEIRLELPASGVSESSFNQVFDIMDYAVAMSIGASSCYWVLYGDFDGLPNTGRFFSDRDVDSVENKLVNFPGMTTRTVLKVADVMMSPPILVETRRWFDTSVMYAEWAHDPILDVMDWAGKGEGRKNAFGWAWDLIGYEPPVVLCPHVLDENEHVMNGASVGNASSFIHYGMLIDAVGADGLADFLVATLMEPQDPLSVIGEDVSSFDVSDDDYVWNWKIWYEFLRGA